jgi:hypothetical protein
MRQNLKTAHTTHCHLLQTLTFTQQIELHMPHCGTTRRGRLYQRLLRYILLPVMFPVARHAWQTAAGQLCIPTLPAAGVVLVILNWLLPPRDEQPAGEHTASVRTHLMADGSLG